MKITRLLLVVFFIAGWIPPTVFRIIAYFRGQELASWWQFAETLCISILTTFSISIAVVSVLLWLHQHFPWRSGVLKRLVLEIILTYATSFILIILIVFIHNQITPFEDLQKAIVDNFIVAFIANSALVAITEGIFFFREWNRTALESEKFEKESIKAQYESLKNQVNPHFLFNSLNTLGEMIEVDPDMSKEFVENLAEVYRYVLRQNDSEVVLIRAEMDFIQAYAALLKKRFGKRISFHFNVKPENSNLGIPPLTLQLLVENAVKHNVSTKESPLKIEIYTKEKRVYVRNNMQLKKKLENSNGMGLENIKNRLKFWTSDKLIILDNERFFQVSVPLISIDENSRL